MHTPAGFMSYPHSTCWPVHSAWSDTQFLHCNSSVSYGLSSSYLICPFRRSHKWVSLEPRYDRGRLGCSGGNSVVVLVKPRGVTIA
jgi:hypothetical protein